MMINPTILPNNKAYVFLEGSVYCWFLKAGLHESRDFDNVKLNVWSCER